MAEKLLREGLLFCYGNPLLDIQARVDKAFLDKWNLQENDAILCEDARLAMFDDLAKFDPIEYVAGGATQNTARVCQWILKKPNVVIYVGCIGKDENGKILEAKARAVGVNPVYQYHPTEKTGTCAVCISGQGQNRSLCANLAAANCFTIDHLLVPENTKLYEGAEFYYVAGFPLTVCPEAVLKLAKHAAEHNKEFFMNISAPFIASCSPFKERLMETLPYVDFLFGNETEALAVAEENKFGTKSMPEIATKIALLDKVNKARGRTVIITQGFDTVVVAQGGEVKEYAVPEVDHIEDTNGTGDSFVGGFLAQYVQGKPIEECIRCGNWCLSVVIQRSGCTLPSQCDYQ